MRRIAFDDLYVASHGGYALSAAAFLNELRHQAANVKRGLLGTGSMFLLYCSLPEPVPNGLFTRPHPLVWRVVTGAGILYLMLLTFILFQTVHDARVQPSPSFQTACSLSMQQAFAATVCKCGAPAACWCITAAGSRAVPYHLR